jgi:hypothetical protein
VQAVEEPVELLVLRAGCPTAERYSMLLLIVELIIPGPHGIIFLVINKMVFVLCGVYGLYCCHKNQGYGIREYRVPK